MTESNQTPGLELPPYLLDGLARWARGAHPERVTADAPQPHPHDRARGHRPLNT